MVRYYRYTNPHPLGKDGLRDCVKRAITLATGNDYLEVQKELNRYKKVTGAKVYNDQINWQPYLERELGAIRHKFPATKG